MNKIIIMSCLTIIAIIAIVIIVYKKEKFTEGTGSIVLVTDSSGNISGASSLDLNNLSVNNLDIDSCLTLNQTSGGTGYVMTSNGGGSNPTWQPGFMRFIGAYPTTFSGGSVSGGGTFLSANLSNLNPGKTLLVKVDIDTFSGGTLTTQAQLSGGDVSAVFSSPTNSGSYTKLNFTATIVNAHGGSSPTLSIVNTSNLTVNLYTATSVLTVYEIQ
jgi:hypothetical protein